jgi:conjugal transfer/entry exclusion protein
MFISKFELEKIRSQIAFLQDLASKFQTEINTLKASQQVKNLPSKKAKEPRKAQSAEARLLQSARMKAYWAARKAKALTA